MSAFKKLQFTQILPTTISPVQSKWSVIYIAPDITVTTDRLTVNTTASSETGGMALSESGKTSGKFYVEVVQAHSGTFNASQFGLHSGTSGLSVQVGDDANGWGTIIYGAGGNSRASYHSGALSNTSSLAFANLQTARMAVDLDAGKVWLSPFGSSNWIGGGDPASGTSPTFLFTPSGAYYFAACPRSSANSITITDPGAWKYSAPSGFGIWT